MLSTPIPLLIALMSFADIFVNPIARAFSFPSAIIATGDSAGTSSSKAPPGDVSPGHMMFAPARTNLMAPLSTCSFFIIFGYWCNSRKVGM
eukprot:Gb_14183 [translate_table: standard]